MFGPWEIILILLVVLIIFGVGKLPDIGTGIGQGIRNFKNAFRDESDKLEADSRTRDDTTEEADAQKK